jgi:hypothetical protein
LVVGATAGAAGVNDVGADATLNGLFGDVNGLEGAALGVRAAADVQDGAVVGAACASGADAGGANENGELGELKIDGTAGCAGGGGAGRGAAGGGLVNGSGYSGIVLAAAENGFGGGMYCDCCAGCHSGVKGGAAGASGVSSAFSCPGGGGTRPSATRRGSSIPC